MCDPCHNEIGNCELLPDDLQSRKPNLYYHNVQTYQNQSNFYGLLQFTEETKVKPEHTVAIFPFHQKVGSQFQQSAHTTRQHMTCRRETPTQHINRATVQ